MKNNFESLYSLGKKSEIKNGNEEEEFRSSFHDGETSTKKMIKQRWALNNRAHTESVLVQRKFNKIKQNQDKTCSFCRDLKHVLGWKLFRYLFSSYNYHLPAR